MVDDGVRSSRNDAGSASIDRDARRAELTDRARELAAQIGAVQAELVSVVRSIQHIGPPPDMTVRQWVSWKCGLTPAEAGRIVRLAERLEELPQLSQAFEEGRLSEGTVVTLARVATPENEARVLETAEVATGAQLQKLTGAFASAKEVDRRAEGGRPDESLTYRMDDAGMWRMSARLRPENGAYVESALRSAWEQEAHGPEALVHLARAALESQTDGGGPLPERFLSLIHVEADGHAHAEGTGELSPGSLQEVLCESWVSTVVMRGGEPISASVPSRLATPAQHRALRARDRTCQFPGCGRTNWLKAHHVVHHADGGPTRIDNLVLLCQVHHTTVHKPGWRLSRQPDGRVLVVRPDGTQLGGAVRIGSRPERPPPAKGDRSTGTHDRLDQFAASVVVSHWMT